MYCLRWVNIFIFLFCCTAKADGDLFFHGAFLEPAACEINNDKTIVVWFGSTIGINKISTGIYRQEIPLTINCVSNVDNSNLNLSLNGELAEFDKDMASIRSTEQASLGIKFYLNDTTFPLGKKETVDINNLPKLHAVLVKEENKDLTTGEFSAMATIRAEYQ